MHSNLSKLYRQTQMDSAPSGRGVEISVLEMASGKMRAVLGAEGAVRWSRGLDESLKFNQKIWDVLIADWSNPECSLEDGLRGNLLSLGIFVKKRTFAMLAQPTREGIAVLVEVNDNIASGLRRGQNRQAEDPALIRSDGETRQ